MHDVQIMRAAAAHLRIGSNLFEHANLFTSNDRAFVDSWPCLHVSYQEEWTDPADAPVDTVAAVVRCLADAEAARRWLAEMVPIAKSFGKVTKFSDDYAFGIEVIPEGGSSWQRTFRAQVPASTTCFLVETDELEVIVDQVVVEPAVTKEVITMKPVVKKVCPPSILHSTFEDVVLDG